MNDITESVHKARILELQKSSKPCETCGAQVMIKESNKNDTVILCKKCRAHLDTYGYVMNELN